MSGRAALVAVAAAASLGAAGPVAARPLSAAALEARHGLRIARIAVVGGGGLVDLRLTVVDHTKAGALLHGHATPRLEVVPGGAVLQAPAHGGHSLPARDGQTGYVLFPNTGSAVRPGGRVSVVFGKIRVEPVEVR